MPIDDREILQNLFHLNHWAKAHDFLTRRDRMVLCEIKLTEVRKLFERDVLVPLCTIRRPNRDLDRLYETEWEGAVLDLTLERWGPKLNEEQLRALLNRLYLESIAAGEPLDDEALDKAGVTPDVFLYASSIFRKIEIGCNWADVDEVIDPCWYWLTEFRSSDSHPRFCFHLPYRESNWAGESPELVDTEQDGEYGEQFGRAITKAESLEHPIVELVEFFGRKAAEFPNSLESRKDIEERIRASRHVPYYDEEDDDEFEDDFGVDCHN